MDRPPHRDVTMHLKICSGICMVFPGILFSKATDRRIDRSGNRDAWMHLKRQRVKEIGREREREREREGEKGRERER